MSNKTAVIVSAVRTPIGSFGGAFKHVSAVQLGVAAAEAALTRVSLSPDAIDEVIIGNVLHAGAGQNIARQVSIGTNIPVTSPAFTVDMVCGSGLKSVELAAQAIIAGDADIVLAGGTENMSQAPFVLPDMRWGARMGERKVIDTLVYDGLTDIFNGYHMGITAENIAKQFNISRIEQDRLAYQSQMKASQAQQNGRFTDEIVPITVPNRKGPATVVSQDEFIKGDTTSETLAKLAPAFLRDGTGTVTAGNASGISDGAAMVVVMSASKAAELGIKPLATILSYASQGVSPEIMGTGPIPATRLALKKAGLTIKDIDLIEANEAFAAQALSVIQELGLNEEIVNVNGGAIALGHPIGASGTRILVTLLHEMKKREVSKGLATLCIGGGQGTALLIENCR